MKDICRGDSRATRQDAAASRATVGCALVGIVVLASASETWAADAGTAAPDAQSAELGEVVVTAAKTSQSINKVPIALSALTMDQLKDQNITQVSDLTTTVPDLQIHTTGSIAFTGITIRGISNQNYNFNGNPAVATYIDGVYVGASPALSSSFYDLARIEVLRGPQGTLYGRNATGGNVNIVTADPEHGFNAMMSVSYGSFNDVRWSGTVNVPISDTLDVRVSAISNRSDGVIATEGTTVSKYQASDEFGGRVTALWAPTGNFKWRISVEDLESRGTPGTSIEVGNNGEPVNGLSPYDKPTSGVEPLNRIRNLAVRSRMDLDFGSGLQLAYIAGYQNVHAQDRFEILGHAAGANPLFVSDRLTQGYSYSHELDLTFTGRAFDNVLGATSYYQSGRGPTSYYLYAANGNFASLFATPTINKSWGAFDQVTLHLADNLRLIGGLRYSKDTQTVYANPYESFCPLDPTVPFSQLNSTVLLPGCIPLPQSGASASWSHVDWKAGAEYDVGPHSLAYATVTTGYKAGEVQPALPANLRADVAPEKVTSYELGLKTTLLNNRWNIRSAAFFENYTDLQVSQFVTTGSMIVQLDQNAAAAHIYGLELESRLDITPADHLNGFVNYLHATYNKYRDAVNGLTGAIVPSLDGNSLPNAPRFSLQAEYAHDFTLPNGGMITPALASYWQSRSYLSEINAAIDKVPAYSRSSARLAYVDAAGHWHLSGMVDNLENHAVRNSEYAAAGAMVSDFFLPRTYSLSLSYHY